VNSRWRGGSQCVERERPPVRSARAPIFAIPSTLVRAGGAPSRDRARDCPGSFHATIGRWSSIESRDGDIRARNSHPGTQRSSGAPARCRPFFFDCPESSAYGDGIVIRDDEARIVARARVDCLFRELLPFADWSRDLLASGFLFFACFK
jgi:hypothetical protein